VNCKHFGVCGGCTLPGVPYAEQLAKKRQELSRLLAIPVPPLIPSPAESGFRNKVAFVFAHSTPNPGSRRNSPLRAGPVIMGHYALGSQRIVPIDECPVHHERGNRIAFALRDRLFRARVPAGILRHIVIRTTADGREASATLVVTRNDKSLRTPVRGLLSSAEKPDGFFINIHDKPGPFMIGDETIKIDGRSHVKETIGDVSYLVSPTAFFQTNSGAAGELVKLVLEAIDEPKGSSPQRQGGGSSPHGQGRGPSPQRVLDLFCGSGLFSLPIAKTGARVLAIEENRQAITDAETNVRLNKIPAGQIRFLAARVEDALSRVERDPWDAVVLDPPRQGCPPAVLAGVFERMRPPRAVYVSCNPDALAQELPGILKAGYRVSRVQPVDMFPHTDHIETVIAFERR
jgi:23S rRNA (uracil1939-C5)-methyltransferase